MVSYVNAGPWIGKSQTEPVEWTRANPFQLWIRHRSLSTSYRTELRGTAPVAVRDDFRRAVTLGQRRGPRTGKGDRGLRSRCTNGSAPTGI